MHMCARLTFGSPMSSEGHCEYEQRLVKTLVRKTFSRQPCMRIVDPYARWKSARLDRQRRRQIGGSAGNFSGAFPRLARF